MVFNPKETQTVSMDRAELIEMLRTDRRFFLEFCFPDHDLPVPDVHIDVFERMINLDINLFACAIPRDHAKTTLVKAAIVYIYLFRPFSFGIYVTNTLKNAKNACKDVKEMFFADNFIAVFGQPHMITEQSAEGIYQFDIITADGNSKRCILQAFSLLRSTRGLNVNNRRPEFAVCDDIEDRDNADTEDKYEKNKTWFYGTFYRALNSAFDHEGREIKRVIHLGNMLFRKSLLWDHVHSKYWYSMHYGVFRSDFSPLWPERWSRKRIIDDYIKYTEIGKVDVWLAEMMNMPVPGTNGLIKANEITYRPSPNPDQFEYGFITVDPAYSDKSWANESAVAVHTWFQNIWHTPAIAYGKGISVIDLLLKVVVPLCREWGIYTVGVESNGPQKAVAQTWKWALNVQQIHWLQIVEITTGSQSKTSRLMSWSAMLKAGTYALPTNDIAISQQLLEYDLSSKDNADDRIDACSMSVYMINTYLSKIIDMHARMTAMRNQNAALPSPNRSIDEVDLMLRS